MFGSSLYKSKSTALSKTVKWKRKSSQKNLENNDKRVAVELWRATLPLSTIRNQLKVFEKTLRSVLAFTKANPFNNIKSR
jgi:hypothetical protein